MDIVLSIDLISKNPSIRGGRACLAGTGLRVIDIVMASIFHSRTPGEIAVDYGITLAQTHAALAYYYVHKPELDEDIRQQMILADEYRDSGK